MDKVIGWGLALIGLGIFAWITWASGGRPVELTRAGTEGKFAPLLVDTDGFYWTDYARKMVEEGRWRTRFTKLDNAPEGREVHWASAYLWWLIGVGGVFGLAGGTTWAEGVVAGAPWANPILLVAVILGGMAVAGRVWGWGRAGLLALFLCAGMGFANDFRLAAPDHHGLHDLACLGMLLGLAAGVTTGTEAGRRRGMVVSALFGGLGLWVGATQQCVAIGLAGAGAGLGMLLAAWRKDQADLPEPGLWRIWGWTGGVASFFYYLLEYAPDGMGMRLEVNHPVYALAWIAGGEMLFRLGRWLRCGGVREMFWLAGAAVVAVLPALLILLGPEEWHALKDPVVRRFHAHISEFLPLVDWRGENPLSWAIKLQWLPALAGAGLVAGIAGRAMRPERRVALLSAGVAAAGLLAAACLQARWLGLATCGAGAAGLVWLAGLEREGWRKWGVAAGAGLILLGAGAGEWLRDRLTPAAEMVAAEQVADLQAVGRLGAMMRADAGPGRRPCVVMAPNGPISIQLMFYEGVGLVNSQYWENRAGLEDGFALLGSPDEAVAREVARRRGVTHIVVQADRGTVEMAADIFQGIAERGGEKGAGLRNIQATLAFRLCGPVARPPDWLELERAEEPGGLGEQAGLRVFRVKPE